MPFGYRPVTSVNGKETVRSEVKMVLAGITPEQRLKRSHDLETNLFNLLSSLDTSAHPLKVVGLFLPYRSEPRWALGRWSAFPWRLSYPAQKEDDPGYRFPKDQLPASGPYLECEGEVAKPDVLIVPGLAFSEEGFRLGRGKGWYDRFLEFQRPPLGCVGVCFEDQVRGGWNSDSHDRKMDIIVTEQRVRHCPR